MRLIILGPPGSGKGTQSTMLCQQLHLEHIGTGDLLRAAINEHTPVGVRAEPFVKSGQLVPDEVVNDLVAERFRAADRPTGFVMDGYPRTLKQAEAFDGVLQEVKLPLTHVFLLAVTDDEIIHRVGDRWSCPKRGCKATYHTLNKPPRVQGVCDACGSALVQREDDKPETVKARLIVYHRDTAELIPYYQKRGLLREIPGTGGIDVVYAHLTKELKS